MGRGSVYDIQPSRVQRGIYGLGSKSGFQGMTTVPFFGVGEQLVENMQLDSGFYRRMYGNTLFKSIASTNRINGIFSYQKTDGSYQMIVFYNDGTNNKMRAIEEDGTLVTPSGGAGDVNFSSSTIGFEQIGITGYATTKATAASGNLWSWNGTTLTAVTNCPDNPEFLSRDGERLIVSAGGLLHFSQRSTTALTSFTGGTGRNINGNYNISRVNPTSTVKVQAGVVVFFKEGAEYHEILPNNAGDGLLGETKASAWNYSGIGVSRYNQATVSENYIYIVNEDGIIQIDSLTGQHANLMEQAGSIRKYWDNFDKSDLSIAYAPKSKMILVTVRENGDSSNDRLVCYHVPYSSISKGIKPFYFKTNVNPYCLGVVNNEIYYGSHSNGNIYKLFDSDTFRDGDDAIPIARIFREWDSFGGAKIEKRMQRISTFMSISPDSTVETNLYIDGALEPVETLAVTQSDISNTSSVSHIVGAYLPGVGQEDEVSNSDVIKTEYFNQRFSTYALEVVDSSDNDFRLYGFDIHYTVTGIQNGAKNFTSTALSNQLIS